MAITNIPYVPTTGTACRFEGQTTNFEIIGADVDTTIGTELAAIITAQAPMLIDPKGNKAAVPATIDDVKWVRVEPISCGNLMSDGTEVTVDFIYEDGNFNTMTGGFIDEPEGGIDVAKAFRVLTGGAVRVSVCWAKDFSKAEYAALA